MTRGPDVILTGPQSPLVLAESWLYTVVPFSDGWGLLIGQDGTVPSKVPSVTIPTEQAYFTKETLINSVIPAKGRRPASRNPGKSCNSLDSRIRGNDEIMINQASPK